MRPDCCCLNTVSSFCCVHWLGLYLLIYLTSRANAARMFNAVYLQVSLGVGTPKGPNYAYGAYKHLPEPVRVARHWDRPARGSLCALPAPQHPIQPRWSQQRHSQGLGARLSPERGAQPGPLAQTRRQK